MPKKSRWVNPGFGYLRNGLHDLAVRRFGLIVTCAVKATSRMSQFIILLEPNREVLNTGILRCAQNDGFQVGKRVRLTQRSRVVTYPGTHSSARL